MVKEEFISPPARSPLVRALIEKMTPANSKSNTPRIVISGDDRPAATASRRRVLIVDDSTLLLNFVKETLGGAGYEVATAADAAQALSAARAATPELILLDHLLPDMASDQVIHSLEEDPATREVPVLYMSGRGRSPRPDGIVPRNVIGTLNKPFTSDFLIRTVETHMPKRRSDEPDPAESGAENAPADESQNLRPTEEGSGEAQPQANPFEQTTPQTEEWWSAPPAPAQDTWGQNPFAATEPAPKVSFMPAEPAAGSFAPAAAAVGSAMAVAEADLPNESVTGGAYFCGDTTFFSLNWALQTIGKGQLTGVLRCFWGREPVEILTRQGELVMATTRDSEFYCAEQPISLSNIDQDRIAEARAHQRETGQPLFISLVERGLLLQEPAMQLVQHYGQKLVCHLWTSPRVRFLFEQTQLPAYAANFAAEGDVDHWALGTLRLIQFQDLGAKVNYDSSAIPGYTRDGFERIQELRLTVAEAQFASQFNGVRSIAQIAKNLRLDLKFARLTLFRFLALEIVELWPATVQAKPERKGVFQRFTKSIGLGE